MDSCSHRHTCPFLSTSHPWPHVVARWLDEEVPQVDCKSVINEGGDLNTSRCPLVEILRATSFRSRRFPPVPPVPPTHFHHFRKLTRKKTFRRRSVILSSSWSLLNEVKVAGTKRGSGDIDTKDSWPKELDPLRFHSLRIHAGTGH